MERMESRSRPPDHTDDTQPEGPRVGLASYDPRDPVATFRTIERFRPRREPRRPGVGTWSLRVLVMWALNMAALVGAGLVLTTVGTGDPFAYVAWAMVFCLATVALIGGAWLLERSLLTIVGPVALLLVVDVVLVWLMTLIARPLVTPDLTAIAEAGAVMWAANLPLAILLVRRRP
jgi:hypothetical protein